MRRFFLYFASLVFLSPFLAFSLELDETLTVEDHLLPFSSGFIHYRLQNQKLQLIFLNQKKSVIAPPAEEALVQVRFINPRTQADKPYTLPLVSQGAYLEAIRPFKLPLNYRLFITLKMTGNENTLSLPIIELRPLDWVKPSS